MSDKTTQEFQERMDRINATLTALEKHLGQTHHNAIRGMAFALAIVAGAFFLGGKGAADLGNLSLSEFLYGFVVEIGGAFLTFWLLDTIWHNRVEKNQQAKDLILRLKHTTILLGQLAFLRERVLGREPESYVENVIDLALARIVEADLFVETEAIDAELQAIVVKNPGLLSRIRSLLGF